jgi:hypothetical protein
MICPSRPFAALGKGDWRVAESGGTRLFKARKKPGEPGFFYI